MNVYVWFFVRSNRFSSETLPILQFAIQLHAINACIAETEYELLLHGARIILLAVYQLSKVDKFCDAAAAEKLHGRKEISFDIYVIRFVFL